VRKPPVLRASLPARGMKVRVMALLLDVRRAFDRLKVAQCIPAV
jgi:hypothetical protein